MKLRSLKINLVIFATLLVVIAGCKKSKQETNYSLELKMLSNSYAMILRSNMDNFKTKTTTLDDDMNNWYIQMDFITFNLMKESWKKARTEYNRLEPFMFSNSSINPFRELNPRIGLFVTNPSFIDETSTNLTSGIIPNSTMYPTINYTLLDNLHLVSAPDNVAYGFHAIEFLIWGEDLNPNGPGERISFDFENSGTTTKARRKQYLKVINQSLILDIDKINLNSFETNLYSLNGKESLTYILSGVYRFVKDEFAEKTIKKPYDTQNQIFEESQYSDNTINDIKNKISSLKNFMYGSLFESSNSYFLMDYIKKKSPEIYDKIDSEITSLETDANNLEGLFDNGINSATERPKYLRIYNSLISISNSLNEFASLEGISNL